MRQATENIHLAKNSGKAPSHIIGAHLEGPYLSAAQCGAQCPDFITAPIAEEYKSLVENYSQSIARWTYAPEQDQDGTPFIVEDGVCKLRDRTAFAGSVATADQLLRFAVQDCGFDMITAVSMLTAVPAKILNLPKGRIEVGLDADLAIFDENYTVTHVFVDGVCREVTQ